MRDNVVTIINDEKIYLPFMSETMKIITAVGYSICF